MYGALGIVFFIEALFYFQICLRNYLYWITTYCLLSDMAQFIIWLSFATIDSRDLRAAIFNPWKKTKARSKTVVYN